MLVPVLLDLPGKASATSDSPESQSHQVNRAAPFRKHNILRPIEAFNSEITSVSLSHPHRILASTSSGSSVPPVILLTRLLSADDMGDGTSCIDQPISMRLSPSDSVTIFTSAANPWHGGSPPFAFGTSDGFIALHPDLSFLESVHNSSTAVEVNSDVLALDWLSPNVLATGLRNTEVLLYDSRSDGLATRLRHSGAVMGLRRADDESRLVVCGFPDALSMYDLRMLIKHEPPQTDQERKPRPIGRSTKGQPPPDGWSTVPLVRFDYSNKYRYPLGFDVNAEVGLVAAADEDGLVQLYSLQSGKRVKGVPDVQAEGSERHQIKCVRFVETPDRATKIMAAVGPRVVELAW